MSYLDMLLHDGFAVFERLLPSRDWFDDLYRITDVLMDSLSDEVAAEWRQSAFDWLSEEDNASYFCGAPPAYRDRAGTEGKRNKAYIQWCLEYARSRQYAETGVASMAHARELTAKLELLHAICSETYVNVLADFEADYPEFVGRYDPERPLPILFKLVRYNRSPRRFATDPHFDKSGFSIILRADDEKVQWRLGKGNPCRISTMTAPIEYPADSADPNPAILFSGLCLEAVGVKVPPTPHFVLPVEQKKYRHSIIAFLLVPHVDTDNLVTDAPYIQDALMAVA